MTRSELSHPDDIELRMRCLGLARDHNLTPRETVGRAQALYDFAIGLTDSGRREPTPPELDEAARRLRVAIPMTRQAEPAGGCMAISASLKRLSRACMSVWAEIVGIATRTTPLDPEDRRSTKLNMTTTPSALPISNGSHSVANTAVPGSIASIGLPSWEDAGSWDWSIPDPEGSDALRSWSFGSADSLVIYHSSNHAYRHDGGAWARVNYEPPQVLLVCPRCAWPVVMERR